MRISDLLSCPWMISSQFFCIYLFFTWNLFFHMFSWMISLTLLCVFCLWFIICSAALVKSIVLTGDYLEMHLCLHHPKMTFSGDNDMFYGLFFFFSPSFQCRSCSLGFGVTDWTPDCILLLGSFHCSLTVFSSNFCFSFLIPYMKCSKPSIHYSRKRDSKKRNNKKWLILQ